MILPWVQNSSGYLWIGCKRMFTSLLGAGILAEMPVTVACPCTIIIIISQGLYGNSLPIVGGYLTTGLITILTSYIIVASNDL